MKRDVEMETLREGMGMALHTIALLKAEVARLRVVEGRYNALKNIALFMDSGENVGDALDEVADGIIDMHGRMMQ